MRFASIAATLLDDSTALRFQVHAPSEMPVVDGSPVAPLAATAGYRISL